MSRYAAEEGRLVYVGNLPEDVKESDIEELFGKYGRIKSVDIKTPARPPPFAFVEFDDRRDATDAVRGRDGYDFYGYRIRVEIAKGRGGGRDGGRDDGRDAGRTRDFRAPNTGFRVVVKGLPASASWQDLKDFFRQVARPAYTNVTRDRDRDGAVGVVEFETAEDMDRAIRKLDDTEFSNPFDRSYIRIVEDRDSGNGGRRGRSRSRSPRDRKPSRRSPSPSRSRSRSPRARGRSPSRSKSPRGRSPSRSRSPVPKKRAASASPAPARDPSRSPARGTRSPSPKREAAPVPLY